MNEDIEETTDPETDEPDTSLHEVPAPMAEEVPKASVTSGRRKLYTKKKLIIAGIVGLIVIAAITAVPFLRYGLMGMFVSKQVVLTVVDSANNKPVSDAKVSLGRFDGSTDAKGRVAIDGVPVGEYTVEISKKNYKSLQSNYVVPVLFAAKESTTKIQATGRTVTLTITNNINGQPVSNASIDIEGATAVSDDKGMANVVLPVKQAEQAGSVKADNYNKTTVKIQMKTNDDQKLDVKLTPAGKVYFLSKRTGTINVMSSDLDSTNQAVVLTGTGRELDGQTSLLPSPDWGNLVLIARRDADREKVYALSPAGQLRLIDDSEAVYQPIGWVADRFYYKAINTQQSSWTNKTQMIMSYNADSGQRQEVDSTLGSGTNYYDMVTQNFSNPAIIDGKVVYVKYWNYGASVTDRTQPTTIVTVDGSAKTTLKSIPATTDIYADTVLRKPDTLIIRLGKPDSGKDYYQYVGGKVTASTVDDTAFYNNRASYQMSPDGSKAFWSEVRDGKTVAFEASRSLSDITQVSTADFTPYGWYTDDYVLYSKNMSELYISPANDILDGVHKITDYHKAMGYEGYGSGPGGAAY